MNGGLSDNIKNKFMLPLTIKLQDPGRTVSCTSAKLNMFAFVNSVSVCQFSGTRTKPAELQKLM